VKVASIVPVFVEFVPEALEEGVLYISETYATAIHKCCCGCGEEVVTPLSSVDWELQRRGDVVSLWPSIGNWNYACKSHYWIRRNRVQWAASMSDAQIRRLQARERWDRDRHIESRNAARTPEAVRGGSWMRRVLQKLTWWLR
jgi:uncharacterized protein DUF6527